MKSIDDKAEITITNNGIGIPKSRQNRIFILFYGATEHGSGNGIGLYSLRFSVMKLGGQISFESKKGEGSKFTVYLPNRRAIADVQC